MTQSASSKLIGQVTTLQSGVLLARCSLFLESLECGLPNTLDGVCKILPYQCQITVGCKLQNQGKSTERPAKAGTAIFEAEVCTSVDFTSATVMRRSVLAREWETGLCKQGQRVFPGVLANAANVKL